MEQGQTPECVRYQTHAFGEAAAPVREFHFRFCAAFT